MIDRLLHCSDPRCSELVYLSESIPGRAIAANLTGRYCVASARSLGYYTEADRELLERLLREGGLFGDPTPPPRPRRVRHYQGQGVLEL